MELDERYLERVYAGVLGKVIGVYAGRPFEQWPLERLLERFGEIDRYVAAEAGKPLVVPDDDITGTFTFLRALPDSGCDPELTPEQVAEAWLNYIVPFKSILWWGGFGVSTEHTAYVRLRQGVKPPESGSIGLNGATVAEQIGAQIFIDGWGLVSPGDAAQAASLAKRAACVSHDGEAIYGAQVIAAMVAMAFVETDLDRLIDAGLSVIPKDCAIRRLVDDMRKWHAEERDWFANLQKLRAKWGYERYGGGCHILPNHGVVMLALLHGWGDFTESMKIVNTSAYDTDCNAANVGCILGVRNGLEGLTAGYDWRTPVADRLLLPTADGGRCISDALTEAVTVANYARGMRREEPFRFKMGAKFHFSLPGSQQGFTCDNRAVKLGNEGGALAIDTRYIEAKERVAVMVPTFMDPSQNLGYAITCCPKVYAGQTVTAEVEVLACESEAAEVRLAREEAGPQGEPVWFQGEPTNAPVGSKTKLSWKIEGEGGAPISRVGLQVSGRAKALLHWLTWDDQMDVTLLPHGGGKAAQAAWINSVDTVGRGGGESLTLAQNKEIGIHYQGTMDWSDYVVESRLQLKMGEMGGLILRCQGMRRYYSLELLGEKGIRIVRTLGEREILGQETLYWPFETEAELRFEAKGSRLRGFLNGQKVVEARDQKLACGAAGWIVGQGCLKAATLKARAV